MTRKTRWWEQSYWRTKNAGAMVNYHRPTSTFNDTPTERYELRKFSEPTIVFIVYRLFSEPKWIYIYCSEPLQNTPEGRTPIDGKRAYNRQEAEQIWNELIEEGWTHYKQAEKNAPIRGA